jgi:hypothetical protein
MALVYQGVSVQAANELVVVFEGEEENGIKSNHRRNHPFLDILQDGYPAALLSAQTTALTR